MTIAKSASQKRHPRAVKQLTAYRPEGYHPLTGHLLLATLALNLLSLALPIMTLQVYDRILPNPDSGTLPILMAGVSFAILCETGLRLARAWIIGWNGAVYEQDLSSRAMHRILDTDVSRSEKSGIGDFLHRLTAISKLKDYESGTVAVTLMEIAFIPVFLGIIFYIAAPLTPVPLALLIIFVAVAAFQGRKLQSMMRDRDTADDSRYEYLIECLKGTHTIKAFALENLLTRRYEYLQEKSGLSSFYAAEASTRTYNFGTMMSHLMMAAVMTAGAIAVIGGSVTTGALIATLQLSGRLMQPAQRGLSLWARYQEVALARSKVAEIFSTPRLPAATDAETPQPTGYLSVRNVSFRNILHGISLDLAPGDVISISGAPGCGKTALMEIIAGLYPPDSGEIFIDDMDIRRYPAETLSRHTGYIATEGVIFQGSIRDNITCFGTLPEPSAQDIARRLYVDRDVARLPSGFDTQLQPQGGDQVAPGLRQRIAMTRTLAAHPKIILFDEADRALDRDGYNTVYRLLGKLGTQTAMILISDDANITDLATRHYVLEDGKLTERALTSTVRRHTAPVQTEQKAAS